MFIILHLENPYSENTTKKKTNKSNCQIIQIGLIIRL
jgi:hypothetical protein